MQFVMAHTQQIGAISLATYFWGKAMLRKYFKVEVSHETDLFISTVAAILGVTVGT